MFAHSRIVTLAVMLVVSPVVLGCSKPKDWPESPLYETPVNDPNWQPPATRQEAMEAMEGRYANYNVVAYAGDTPNGPLSTFVISYGFTDLIIENGELIEYDTFCSAAYKANQNLETTFPDAATQAILPRSTAVEVYEEAGEWKLRRPATPTLLGINGNPDVPLSTNPNDPLVRDDDNDGKPGVTVFVTLFGLIRGEIYIARREIYQNFVTLYADGTLRGNVVDDSEQLVINAFPSILNVPNSPAQFDDPGLNPIILVPLPEHITTCEDLIAYRDTLFPPEPKF